MLSWKEKVAAKLSRILADSSSSPTTPSGDYSPIAMEDEGSTLKHGISLQTLLRNSADLPGPCLLIVGDMQGAIFGGLLNSPLKPTSIRKYQGTGETFVFSTIYGEPRFFRATGANRFYYLCLNDQLAFGGGRNYALSLEEDLLHGTSGPCETFGNSCLAHTSEFELKNVELWGFAHSSRLLT